MKFIDKLERKFGRFCIPNLMLYVVIGNVIVYLFSLVTPVLQMYLLFDWELILQGQVWRLVSFIFTAFNGSNLIFALIGAYFYYMIGQQLEAQWGSFKFNVFYIFGFLLTILGGVLAGIIAPDVLINTSETTVMYLNLSLFLAFALLYPNMQFLVFFIIPLKAKYLAYFDIALLAWSFIFGNLDQRITIGAAAINILLFFSGDMFTGVRDKFRYRKNRRNFKIYMQSRNEK